MNDTKIISAEPPSYTLFLNPPDMLRNLYQSRSIIRQFTWREAIGRYKGAYLGLIWALINPLMTLVVYTLVFGVILKVGFGSGGKLSVFVLNFFCGLIVYNVFAQCVGRAATLIRDNPNYVKKVIFPLEIMPVAILGSSLLH